MRKRKMREEDERCREQKGGARIKKGMESKINCSRHLVVTGKVITCAGFSSAATYPCRIPRRSQLFSRLYFRLTPVIEKGLSSTGQIFLRWGGTVRWRGEEKPWGETLVVISLRTRFGLQRCVFLGCLFAKIRGYDGVERDRCSRALHCIFNFLFWLDCFPFLFFFFLLKSDRSGGFYSDMSEVWKLRWIEEVVILSRKKNNKIIPLLIFQLIDNRYHMIIRIWNILIYSSLKKLHDRIDD